MCIYIYIFFFGCYDFAELETISVQWFAYTHVLHLGFGLAFAGLHSVLGSLEVMLPTLEPSSPNPKPEPKPAKKQSPTPSRMGAQSSYLELS